MQSPIRWYMVSSKACLFWAPQASVKDAGMTMLQKWCWAHSACSCIWVSPKVHVWGMVYLGQCVWALLGKSKFSWSGRHQDWSDSSTLAELLPAKRRGNTVCVISACSAWDPEHPKLNSLNLCTMLIGDRFPPCQGVLSPGQGPRGTCTESLRFRELSRVFMSTCFL